MKWTTLSGVLSLSSLASACLLPEERNGGVLKRSRIDGRQRNTGKAIGTGDRFNGGRSFPRGVGSGNETDMSTILNVNEVNSALKGLAAEYGFETFTTPYKSYEGASFLGGKVGGAGGTCNDAYRVYLNGAIHARERGSSDNILYFISDLLYANRAGTGLTYGNKKYTNAEVQKALSAGIVFLPLSNPDGVAYDQSTHSCWRKNRNPEAASGSRGVGVDLNRNFDFVWDLNKWARSVRSEVASSTPSSEVYHGSAPFSEPETRSMKWVLDTFSKVRWFVDLHSYAGDVLFSWGSDTNQASRSYMNFLNSTYDGVRGLVDDSPSSVYGEYIPQDEWDDAKEAAERLSAAMTASTRRSYSSQQAAAFYPTSGASDDYSFSRHFADPSLNKVYGYTIEFGFGNNAASCPFYPSDSQYQQNLIETNAGFMEFLLTAVDIGLGDAQKC